MIKLIKLLILPYTFSLKNTVHLAITIAIIQGKSSNLRCVLQTVEIKNISSRHGVSRPAQ